MSALLEDDASEAEAADGRAEARWRKRLISSLAPVLLVGLAAVAPVHSPDAHALKNVAKMVARIAKQDAVKKKFSHQATANWRSSMML